jgi:hypothetical protein
MAREPQTIEVHVLGEVTFRPLGKVAMERLQEAARRKSDSPLPGNLEALRKSPDPVRAVENSMLIGEHVVKPKLSTAEFLDAIKGHEHVIDDIADSIRAASWPNQPAT